MATINEILSIGKSGLSASKSQLAIASFNVANAQTPGYSRRIQDLSANSVLGLGVSISDPYAVKNQILAKSLLGSLGDMGFQKGKVDSLALVTEAFNDLDGIGLASSINDFQTALDLLAANPAGTAERQGVLGSALQLSASFSTTRQQIQDGITATVATAQSAADDVSLKAQKVLSLNKKIQALHADGQDIGTLVDQRDALLTELGQLMDIQVVNQSDGTVMVYTNAGQALVTAESASTITVSDVGPSPDYAVEVTITKGDGTSQGAIGGNVGGELGGLVDTVNKELGPALETIDQMAFFFMAAFNVQHQVGFAADGSTGNDFFELPASVAGAASNVKVSDDVDGKPDKIAAASSGDEVPGGNGNVLFLADVPDQPFVLPSGLSVNETFEILTFDLAQAYQSAELGFELEASSAVQLETLLLSETAVSVDEELIAMAQANHAFEAASAVIQRTEQMSQTLLNMVG